MGLITKRAGRARRSLRQPLMRTTALVTAATVLMTQTAPALAAPEGAAVQAGRVSISTPAAGHTRIDQATRNAIVNWRGFSIGAGESVRFAMPDSGSAILNRVTGPDPSRLLGRLSSNGNVFLINPHGVVIGRDAVIDTHGFAASTLDMADQDFLNRHYDFLGDSTAGVVNHGTIRAAGGDIALIGHTVENDGTLSAPDGRVALGAGNDVRYVPGDGGGLQIRAGLDVGTETGIDNSGLIEAATAELKAAGGNVYDLAVNQEGVVRASGVREEDGRIILTADGGAVRNAGTLRATRGDDGGEIYMGGGFQGGDAAIANAATSTVTADGVIDVSAAGPTGDGGTAVVWADGATAFAGTALGRGGATGGDGGLVEVSGGVLGFQPTRTDVSAPAGRSGTLLLDPGNVTITTAASSNLDTSDPARFDVDNNTLDTIIQASTIMTALQTGNVTVQTAGLTGGITLDTDLAWTTDNDLMLNAAAAIALNGSVSGGADSALYLVNEGAITQAADKAISVGTLSIESFGTGGDATFNGTISANEVLVNAAGTRGAFTATNAGNAIGTVTVRGGFNGVGNLDIVDGAGDLTVSLGATNAMTAAPEAMQFRTPGDLTLAAGSSLTGWAGGSGRLVLVSGGAFINNSGPAPIATDATHDLRIYAADSGRTVMGGLAAQPIFGQTYASLGPDSAQLTQGIDYILYVDASGPTLVFSANNASRVYGEANPAFTYSLSGLEDGDTLGSVVTGGAPSLTTAATATSNAGIYAISTDGSGLFSTKYALVFQGGQLTVTPAPLTVSVTDSSRDYGSATLDTAITSSISGLRNGDTVAGLGLSYVVDQDPTTPATNGTPRPITARITNGNYMIHALQAGDLTINRAPLSASLGSQSRAYGDLLDPATVAGGLAWSGFVNGDDASAVTLSLDDDATWSVAGGPYALTGAASANNYTVAITPGTLTVTPAPLTVTLGDTSRTYGETALDAAIQTTVHGLKNGDTRWDLGLTHVLDLNAATSVTGTTPLPIRAAIDNGNYTIAQLNEGALTINTAPLVITGRDYTRGYGYDNPTFAITVDNLKLGHTIDDIIAYRATSSTASRVDLGTYPITVDAALSDNPLASNYSIVEVNNGTLTVEKSNRGPITIQPIQTNLKIQVNKEWEEREAKRRRGSIIVIITPPGDPAGDTERQAIQGEAGRTALSDATAKLKENWPKNQPMDAKTKAYMDSILNGTRSLDQVLNDAEAGDATARTVMAAVMPILVSALAQKDPASLSGQEKALLDKVQNRIEERRAALVAKVEAKVAAHDAKRKGDARGFTKLFASRDFPDVLQEAIVEVNTDVIAKSAAVVGGAAAAGAAAAGASVALASVIFPFAGSATIISTGGAAVGHVAGTSAAAVAGAAAAPIALTIGLAAAIGAAGIIKLIESGENEKAYNDFVNYNSKSVDLGALATGSNQAKAELALASSQIYMEMFGI